MRFDGKTHQSLDLGLCRERAPCEATLCSGFRCTHTRLALSAALTAIQRRLGDSSPFGQQLGTFDCHINLSRRGPRYVIGSCTTAVRLQGAHAAIVHFTERWRREYRRGRWVSVPPRTHTWRVFVSHDGWETRITSTGDPPQRLAQKGLLKGAQSLGDPRFNLTRRSRATCARDSLITWLGMARVRSRRLCGRRCTRPPRQSRGTAKVGPLFPSVRSRTLLHQCRRADLEQP
jgi:hypothetical protein